MTTLKKKLENIYNANQCTDLNDVEYALEQTRELVKIHDWTPALRKRVVSLENRKIQLTK
jgi:hypothetical protein